MDKGIFHLVMPVMAVAAAWASISSAGPAAEGRDQAAGVAVPLRLVRIDPRRGPIPEFPHISAFKRGQLTKAPANSGVVSKTALVCTFAPFNPTLRVAIDATKAGEIHPDILRLDVFGKGNFRDVPTIPRSNLFNYFGSPAYQFEAKDLIIDTGRAKVPVWCFGNHTRRGSPRLDIQFGWGAMGRWTLGQKTHSLRLIDCNANFRLSDPARQIVASNGTTMLIRKGDWIQVDFGAGKFSDLTTFYGGQPLGIKGKLYDLRVSDDLKTARITPYAGPTAAIQIDHDDWEAKLMGRKRIIVLRGDRSPMPVPPGRYVLRKFFQYSAKAFNEHRHYFDILDGSYQGGRDLKLNLMAARTQKIPIGSPLTAVVGLRNQNGKVFVNVIQQAQSGRRVAKMIMWGAGGWIGPAEMTVEFLDARGDPVDKVAVKYWGESRWTLWKAPAGTRGVFKAKLRYVNKLFGEIRIAEPVSFYLSTDAQGKVL
jgi:hypothetical protein